MSQYDKRAQILDTRSDGETDIHEKQTYSIFGK